MDYISRRKLLELGVGLAATALLPGNAFAKKKVKSVAQKAVDDSEELDKFLTNLANERNISKTLSQVTKQIPTPLPSPPKIRYVPHVTPISALDRLVGGDSFLVAEAVDWGKRYLDDNSQKGKDFRSQIREAYKYEDYIERHRDQIPLSLCQSLIIAESDVTIDATSLDKDKKPLARGLTQLIEQTAKKFGLRIDNIVDERLKPERSIYGGFEFLNALLQNYGDYRLALIAYNGGPLRVQNILKGGLRNASWRDIKPLLKEETQKYVPKVLGLNWAKMRLVGEGKISKPQQLYSEFIRENSREHDAKPNESLFYLALKNNIKIDNLKIFNPQVIDELGDLRGEKLRIPYA